MNTVWQSPPKPLVIADGAAHIWRLRVDTLTSEYAQFRTLLNADECARADRFRFECDRSRFVVTRGVLRTLLARYTGVGNSTIAFVYSSHGKPALDSSAGHGALEFNVSHSGTYALIGLTRNRAIGVDVEQIEPRVSQDKIAERFFSPDEVSRLHALPPDERQAAFFRCWTRKEAFIKAHGNGLSLPLDSFSVTFGLDEPPRLLRFEGEPGADRWTIAASDVGDGYTGAACVGSPTVSFQFFNFGGEPLSPLDADAAR